MDAGATKLTVETSDGETEEFFTYKDVTFPKNFVAKALKRDLADHVRGVINFEVHESDVFLASFPKAGTHWAWEVISMLRNGSADYLKIDKESFFLDLDSSGSIAKRPPPRVLNSHFTPRCIPRGVLGKGVKIVLINRNIRDVSVSFYNHTKKLGIPFTESFDKFLKLFTGSYGVNMYCSWAHYVKEWEYFAKQHPQQVLSLYYEDMKEDPVREIKKINEFLQCDRSDDLVREIADACSFANLKKADQSKEHAYELPKDLIYRKGEVGDWKNWFTVAQNEQMDQWLEENFTNTNLTFRYTI